MRRLTLTVAVLIVACAAAVAVVRVASDAGAALPGFGPDLPSELSAAPKPLPQVRRATRGIERLQVPGGRALLARSLVRSDRAVIVLHGRGSAAGTVFARPTRAAWAIGLLRGGYSVATADAYGDAWGNDASLRAYRVLVQRLRARGFDRISLIGTSMGGLASLQLLRTVRPVAWAGVYPVFDLGEMFRLGRFADSIRAAYGFNGDTLPAAARARAPVRLPGLRGLPMLIEASPGDTVVPKAANADPLAQAARAAGARVTELQTRGDHGDASNFDPATIVRFLDAAGRVPVLTSGRSAAP